MNRVGIWMFDASMVVETCEQDNCHCRLTYLSPSFLQFCKTTELLVVFKLRTAWFGHITDTSKAKKFHGTLTYKALRDAAENMFNLKIFPSYALRGVTDRGSEYELSEDEFVFERGVEVHILPRYFTREFHISTWAMEYSRAELQRLCKESDVSGSVTRDNINSILVTLSHPDQELVINVYEQLTKIVAQKDGIVDQDNISDRWDWGTLHNRVRTHRGTAKRGDGVRSWEDEDAKSGSTYF
jgi:hypothetical protein